MALKAIQQRNLCSPNMNDAVIGRSYTEVRSHQKSSKEGEQQ